MTDIQSLDTELHARKIDEHMRDLFSLANSTFSPDLIRDITQLLTMPLHWEINYPLRDLLHNIIIDHE